MKSKIVLSLLILSACTSAYAKAMKQSEFISYCSHEQLEYQLDTHMGEAKRVYEKQGQMMLVKASSKTDYVLNLMKANFSETGLKEECAEYLYKNSSLKLDGDSSDIFARVNFSFDDDKLTGESRHILQLLASSLKDSNSGLQLIGHTDSIGREIYNYELGIKRSESVKTYLIENSVNSQGILLDSKGENNPEFNNDTPGGRERNRRVDIELTAF
ncbi:Outer membrane protein A precursor [Moritella sp. JT01]|uniref:OmpA family protein n=1 Tax=Moritella sp. JT01 TaxID=756698 RepID=UPI000797ED16|nr:OmpA family protein [Moritella sp. JT01]KXO09528.1 Outer membrane protein A precursor [Moritella sp. JT01]